MLWNTRWQLPFSQGKSLENSRVVLRPTSNQDTNHPTQGRRRRHKNPSSLAALPLVPPRLVDYLDTADGSLDEEGEKDVKRQRSEPTTPRSTSSRPLREYDEVMGITQVEPREAERLEEGIDSEKMLKNYNRRNW